MRGQEEQREEQREELGRGSAARGIVFAVLLSAPVWLGLAAWIWRLTLAG